MTLNSYEDALADVHSEIVSVVLEYADGKASDIYVYCSSERAALTIDPYFVIEGEIYEIHKAPIPSASSSRQWALLDYGIAQLQRLKEFCHQFSRPMPTEMKLHYALASGTFDADISYEDRYTGTNLGWSDLADKWRQEIQATLA